MEDRDLAILYGDTWFASIPAVAQSTLISHARIVPVRAGDCTYRSGDEPNGLWAVLSGEMRLKGYSANGIELLALILRAGTWFGELSTIDGGPRPHDAIAFTDSRLLVLSVAAFEQAVMDEPSLYRHLAVLACRHQRTALDFIVRTVAQPARGRLAGALTRAIRDDDQNINLRQDELASMVGISRQALSRHLKVLERTGLIALGYGKLQILDLKRLSAIEQA